MLGGRYGNLPGTCLVPTLISPQLEMKSRPHSVPPLAASFRNPDPGERHASDGFMELSGSGRDKGPGAVRVLAARGWLLRRMPFEIAFQTCDQIRFGLAGSAEDLHSARLCNFSIFCLWILETARNGGKTFRPSPLQSVSSTNSTRLPPARPASWALSGGPSLREKLFKRIQAACFTSTL